MPTSREKIEQWSNIYYILKFYVDRCFKFFFPTTISGLENIPKDKTIIFAPNHQNALMDALAVLSVRSDWQPVFLARADIFEKPTINKILTFLKILPIYRMRDGYSNLQKNDDIFRKTMDVLKNKNGLVILPEGNHGEHKRLRPLKKGIARIAFQAEDASEGKMDIHIVPVGLDYTHYYRVGSPLHIRFGHAIRIKPMLAQYRENQAVAYNKLLEMLSGRISAEMIDIEDLKFYEAYITTINTCYKTCLKHEGLKNTHENRFNIQQKIVNGITKQKEKKNDDFLLLIADALELTMLLKKLSLNPELFPTSKRRGVYVLFKLIFLLFTAPLFILSFINLLLPLLLTYQITSRVKDLQFLSSFRFAIGLLIFPFFFLLQIVVFALIMKSLLYTLLYAIAFPLSIYIFFSWKRAFLSTKGRLKEVVLSLLGMKRINRAYVLRSKLSERINNLLYSEETVGFD